MSHFCCLLTKEEDAYLGGDTMPKIIYVSYLLHICMYPHLNTSIT